MNPTSTYAFYGSLRRGMRLYNEFSDALEYKYSLWLPGYALYSLGPYPCAVKTDDPASKILVEVMRIRTRHAEETIHKIEIDAGYYFVNLEVQSETVGIYLFKEAANYPFVSTGDWVTFFGQ